ncbi:MAG: hypothetical protein FD144_229 [Rhodospirillaceae bacterium]|nr:MAG: hypothetical protein FD144_229 [Rhodospirillaceae bacterium]
MSRTSREAAWQCPATAYTGVARRGYFVRISFSEAVTRSR